jgi:hypothetical protein
LRGFWETFTVSLLSSFSHTFICFGALLPFPACVPAFEAMLQREDEFIINKKPHAETRLPAMAAKQDVLGMVCLVQVTRKANRLFRSAVLSFSVPRTRSSKRRMPLSALFKSGKIWRQPASLAQVSISYSHLIL